MGGNRMKHQKNTLKNPQDTEQLSMLDTEISKETDKIMKICTKCKVKREAFEFNRNNRNSSGLQSHCKLCLSAYFRKNRKRLLRNRKKNPEKIKAYRQEYQRKHAERMGAYQKEYRRKKAEKLNKQLGRINNNFRDDPMRNRIKIIIIDEDMHICEEIKSRLSEYTIVEIVGVFHRAEVALTWLKTHTADVATVGYYMSGLHGIALIELLRADCPYMKLIIITSEKNPYLLRQVLQNDVDALLVKGTFGGLCLRDAIGAVIRGETWLQLEFGIPIYRAERDIKVMQTLTETQQYCLEQIARGKSMDEIAHLQNTTSNTVKDRLLQCRKKFHVKTTEDLIKLYHEFYPS